MPKKKQRRNCRCHFSLVWYFSGTSATVAPIEHLTGEAASKSMSVKASCGSVYVGSSKKIQR